MFQICENKSIAWVEIRFSRLELSSGIVFTYITRRQRSHRKAIYTVGYRTKGEIDPAIPVNFL